MYLWTRLLSRKWFMPADKWLRTNNHSSSSKPKLFSGSSRRLNRDPPVHNSITMTFPRPSCSSSMASNLTIFSCFTFCNTSNSRIWTSWGRMWDNWLKVLTATVSPLCLFTPWTSKKESKNISQFSLSNFSSPETPPPWRPCPRHWWCTRRSWPIPSERTWFSILSNAHACQKCKWIQGVFSLLCVSLFPTRAPFSPMLAWDYDTSIWRRAGLQVVASSNVIIFILPFFHFCLLLLWLCNWCLCASAKRTVIKSAAHFQKQKRPLGLW